MDIWEIILRIMLGVVFSMPVYELALILPEFLARKRQLGSKEVKNPEFIIPFIVAYGIGIALSVRNDGRLLYLVLLIIPLLSIAIMDFRYRIIPNCLVVSILLIRILFGFLEMVNLPWGIALKECVLDKGWTDSAIACLGMFIIFCLPALIGKKPGGGDIKLAAAFGAVLGVSKSLVCVAFAGIFMIVYVLFRLRVIALSQNAELVIEQSRLVLKEMVPLGPVMVLSFLVVVILNQLVPVPDLIGAL